MNCKKCNNKLKTGRQKLFCSRSCSASFNNNKRIVSEEQKYKVSQTLRSRYNKKFCKICNKELLQYRHRKTCSSHCLQLLNKSKIPPKTSGGYRRGSGRGKHGWYEGIYFDSTYELAFYLYCKIKGIKIERCKEKFEYINSKGERRSYIPDFRMNNKLIEIKGFANKDTFLKLKAVTEPIEILFKKDLLSIFLIVESYTNCKIKDLYKLYTPDGARTRNPSE